jgi:hypothetical protein
MERCFMNIAFGTGGQRTCQPNGSRGRQGLHCIPPGEILRPPGLGISRFVADRMALDPALTGPQIRAARALLGWAVGDLSERCGVSASAISRAERSDGVPAMQRRNLEAIRAAFEANGVEFLDTSGVRLRRG